jgi:hypothetical protein
MSVILIPKVFEFSEGQIRIVATNYKEAKGYLMDLCKYLNNKRSTH